MLRTSVVTLILTLIVATSIQSSAPQLINYRGRLIDRLDVVVADGAFSVVFTIYDAPIAGNSVWTETQIVNTIDGLFSVLLGSVNPILDTVFNGPARFLGIAVGGDPEISPRAALVSVAFAQRVNTLDGASGGNVKSKVSFGPGHTLSGDSAAIGGGSSNVASGVFSTVGGGSQNITEDTSSTVSGGRFNRARGIYSVVSGGGGALVADSNSALGGYSTVAGGSRNIARGEYSTIGGGEENATGLLAFLALQ